jgi:Uncharacterized protein with SCP/PR1 domains
MNKTLKALMGCQLGILMMAVALPVQAAVNIGAPQTPSGSVVTLRSSVPTTTQVASNPTTVSQWTQTTVSTPTTTTIQNSTPQYQTANIGTSPSTGNGSVISLKTILNQSNPLPITPTPSTPTTTTSTSAATPSTAPTIPVIPAISALTADEQQMVDMINQERIAAGVAPLKVDLRLVSVGQAKANDMKTNNYFDHTSPTYGSPWAMMQQVGLTVGWAGENIAGNNSVSGAMAALMQSPGHKANILDPRFTHVGVGIAYGSAYGNLYVQEFLQE